MVRDAAFGRRMDAIFHDDLRHAEAVDLGTFRRRGFTAVRGGGVLVGATEAR